MDQIVKLNAQTAGRDKIARLLQYLTRVIWHRLQQHNKEGVGGLKNLEYQLSSFRKLLRFGKCIDVLYSILPVAKHEDQTVKITVTLSKICSALFLLADHILWMGRSDLCTVNTDKWGRFCSKYWLYSLLFSLLRDLYEIVGIIKTYGCKTTPSGEVTCVHDFHVVCAKLIRQNKAVTVDFIKNICDVWIPMTALGYTKFSPGTIGMLGVVSSVAGLLVLFDSSAKLSP